MLGIFSARPDPLRLTARERTRLGAVPAPHGVSDGMEGGCVPCIVWEPAPIAPVSAHRLVAYRFNDSDGHRSRMLEAAERWVASSLLERGRARMRLEREAGETVLSYEDAGIFGALLPGARLVRTTTLGEGLPSWAAAGYRAALVTGEPTRGSSPWEALLARGVVAGPMRVTVDAWALPGGRGGWVRDAAARLSAEAARLDRFERTRTVGGEAVRMNDPAAAAARARVEEERRQLIEGGERAMLVVTIEAGGDDDLARAVSLVTASLSCATASGIAPAPVALAVDSVGSGLPIIREALGARPFGAIVPVASIAQAMLPPATPARGLTVVDEDPGTAAAMPLAASGFDGTGEVYLGRTATGAQVALPLASFCRHLVVTGATGMGKSYLTQMIARQLVVQGVGVTVIEPTSKTEYARLIGDLPGVRILGDAPGAEPVALNPFQVDSGVRPRVWVQDLADCLVSAYGLGEQPLPLHVRALIERLYRTHAIDLLAPAAAGGSWPSAVDFRHGIDGYLASETCAGPEVTANVRGALTLRADALASSPALSARRGILARDLLDGSCRVLQLGDLGGAEAAFAGMLLIARIRRAAYAAGAGGAARTGGRPRTVVIVEEAHALLRDARGELTPFARLFSSAMAELRAAQVGFEVVDERASLLPTDVLAHAVTQLHLANRQADDRDAVARALGLAVEQERAFARMGVGEAVMVSSGAPAPELVRIGGSS